MEGSMCMQESPILIELDLLKRIQNSLNIKTQKETNRTQSWRPL
jgi:hypothetical protein